VNRERTWRKGLAGAVLVLAFFGAVRDASAVAKADPGGIVIVTAEGTAVAEQTVTIDFGGQTHTARSDKWGLVGIIFVPPGGAPPANAGGKLVLIGDGPGRITYPGAPAGGQTFNVRGGQLIIGAATLGTAGAATQAARFGGGKRSFYFTAGFERSLLPGIECAGVADFSTRSCNLDAGGFGLYFGFERELLTQLVVGFSASTVAGGGLEQQLVSTASPQVTASLTDGYFDPSIFELYVRPQLHVGENAVVHGQLGIGRWSAGSGGTFTGFIGGQQVTQEVTSQDDSGFALSFGLGADYFFNERIGARASYRYVKLSKNDADIDEPLHRLGLGVVVRFGR